MNRHLVSEESLIDSLKSDLQAERSAREQAEALLADKIQELNLTHEKLKENQAQLVQSEKMASLGQLAAGIAHEINNPVGFVMSNLGTLTEYVDTFKTLFEHYSQVVSLVGEQQSPELQTQLSQLAAILAEADFKYILNDIDPLLSESRQGLHRVKEIVQNLKSFARLDESELKEANINDGIEATLKVVWNELKYKCHVQTQLGKLPSILCYPGQLNQVFMNILVNASQSIQEKGEINIKTEATEKHVVIYISDTGRGIPQPDLSRIFNPFFTTKPVGTGTGLGLSISYGIVQKHKGEIEVASEAGKGTTFIIRLPIDMGGAP